jgi:chromosome segregation ATPase
MEGLKQETENLKTQLGQTSSAAETSQQEAEQYRVQGEGFRQDAVKLGVELKRSQEEVAQLKALASELAGKLQQLEGAVPTAEQEGPSYVDRIIGTATRSAQTGKDRKTPETRAGAPATEQETEEDMEEQPYEAPSFEDLESGIGIRPESRVPPTVRKPAQQKTDKEKVAGERAAPARPRSPASSLY